MFCLHLKLSELIIILWKCFFWGDDVDTVYTVNPSKNDIDTSIELPENLYSVALVLPLSDVGEDLWTKNILRVQVNVFFKASR